MSCPHRVLVDQQECWQTAPEMQTDNTAETEKYHGVIRDKRTRRWREVCEVAAALSAQAGGAITDAQRERIAKAAELTVLSRDVRKRAMANPSPEILNSLTRLENATQRALRGIGITAGPVAPRLQQYLKERGAA